MTVLVLTGADDDTTTRVCRELDDSGHDHIRLDLGDFPEALTVSMAGPGRRWGGEIVGTSCSIRLSDVGAVYYRRPSDFRLPTEWPARHRCFAVAEARQCWAGLLACLPVPFVNQPTRIAAAELKPHQLQVAAELGFPVPRTLITSDATQARAFVGSVEQALYKPLSSVFLHDDDGVKLVYATLVSSDDLDDPAGSAGLDGGAIGWAPCQFQEFIPKTYDVRLIAVGDQCFAVAIHAGSDTAYVDWRADYPALSYEPVRTPGPIVERVTAYLERFGLVMGCFDFTVGPGRYGHETWHFLECGANAQWGWIEHETGLPIARAIAGVLTRSPDG